MLLTFRSLKEAVYDTVQVKVVEAIRFFFWPVFVFLSFVLCKQIINLIFFCLWLNQFYSGMQKQHETGRLTIDFLDLELSHTL